MEEHESSCGGSERGRRATGAAAAGGSADGGRRLPPALPSNPTEFVGGARHRRAHGWRLARAPYRREDGFEWPRSGIRAHHAGRHLGGLDVAARRKPAQRGGSREPRPCRSRRPCSTTQPPLWGVRRRPLAHVEPPRGHPNGHGAERCVVQRARLQWSRSPVGRASRVTRHPWLAFGARPHGATGSTGPASPTCSPAGAETSPKRAHRGRAWIAGACSACPQPGYVRRYCELPLILVRCLSPASSAGSCSASCARAARHPAMRECFPLPCGSSERSSAT